MEEHRTQKAEYRRQDTDIMARRYEPSEKAEGTRAREETRRRTDLMAVSVESEPCSAFT